MDGIITEFPLPFNNYACPRVNQYNFHAKTREACKDGTTGNISLKIAKSIVIGDLSVGKTSLINRYCRNLFEKDYKPTIGVEYELKKYNILEQDFHLQMWDTSGEERFKCITGAYYRGAHVVIVVFDLSALRSLGNAGNWLEDALEKTRSTTPEVFLVGNKVDLISQTELEKTRESAINLANELNAEYWEVSAKTGKNVNEFFTRVAAICFDQAVLRETASVRESNGAAQVGNGLIKTKNQSETIVLSDQAVHRDIKKKYEPKRCCNT